VKYVTKLQTPKKHVIYDTKVQATHGREILTDGNRRFPIVSQKKHRKVLNSKSDRPADLPPLKQRRQQGQGQDKQD
jgi:hypothetical protein